RHIHGRQSRREHLDPRLQPITMEEHLNEMKEKTGIDPKIIRSGHQVCEKMFPPEADVVRGHKYEHGDIDVKQDYEQAAKYFAKAARQGNAEGMYNLARLTDNGLGVKKDHNEAFKLYKQAAAQSPQHPILKGVRNPGVAEAEHALALKYMEGIVVHKNLSVAAMWYQRAIDHGSPTAANNLAIMYQHGEGVNKDLDKAKELYELSSRRGDPNAMLNLAELLLDKNDLEMSRIWHDRACEAGNIQAQSNRHNFQLLLNIKEQYLCHHQPNIVGMMNKCENLDLSNTVKPIKKLSHNTLVYNLDELNEYAERGSITAKTMYTALQHFTQASNVLKQSETLTKEQEKQFVYELAQCYRTEHNVAPVSSVEIREKADKIVDRILEDFTTQTDAMPSQLDEDVRTCYATLHRESKELIVQFLEPCKQRYPKSIYFFQLSAALNSLLGHYEATLYDINAGLEIDPKCYILLYQKAVILNFFDLQPNELIEAHRAFLAVAPKDHPKVPEMYYSIGTYYLLNDEGKVLIDTINTIYELGQEAEKIQLSYFLPYESNTRDRLKNAFDIQTSRDDENVVLSTRKKRLTNQHRIEIIKKHREWMAYALEVRNNSQLALVSGTQRPRVKQHIAKSLIGLKAISIREMNPTKDHVYSGYVLSVTIIEVANAWTPSIHLVVEDENLDSERMFIYGFPEAQGEHLINEVFTIGSKMNIINPYLRLGANDHEPLVRVDDFASIIMHSESERIINMCRCCGKANASHVCGKCKQARYCSKDCQIMDWKLYQHKLIFDSVASMSEELILYHYPQSPFAEKVRMAMGLKKLNWRSVIVDRIPPRPHLQALTGGYRRIPVLQVGADMYCDTHLILRTLDRLRPHSLALFSNRITQPLCWWWDKAMFIPLFQLRVGLSGDKLSKEWLEDRQKFAPQISFKKEDNEKDISLSAQRINAHLVWLINMLGDGREFLLGDSSPSALDITAYYILWVINNNMENETKDLLPRLFQPRLVSWFLRMGALGHGTSKEMTSEEAFDVAKQAEPKHIENKTKPEWHVGQRLQVTPDNMGCIPVEGIFVAADDYEIVLRLTDEKAGNINVHFPRAGFDVI
ncbi:unnamed protein product, partial [Rotaria sp. Silwood1]